MARRGGPALRPYPVDVAWGGQDPILSLRRFGLPMLQATHLPWLRVMRAKHYLQEDRPDEVAALIACNARRAHEPSAVKENAMRSPKRWIIGSATVLLVMTACSTPTTSAPISTPSTSAPEGTVSGSNSAAPVAAVSGNVCPQVFDASTADFYPIQPSFSAGYTAAGQHLTDATADWAYVVEGDFPYSNWMALGISTPQRACRCSSSPTARSLPMRGASQSVRHGNPILAPERRYTLYLMPSDTPDSVVTSMRNQGKNVALLPSSQTTPDVVIVSRSYWSFANDGLGDYDRFGYGGPTDTPTPTIKAYLTDATTGELTDAPVDNCSSQSVSPRSCGTTPRRTAPS